jgi:hypothetical protein
MVISALMVVPARSSRLESCPSSLSLPASTSWRTRFLFGGEPGLELEEVVRGNHCLTLARRNSRHFCPQQTGFTIGCELPKLEATRREHGDGQF